MPFTALDPPKQRPLTHSTGLPLSSPEGTVWMRHQISLTANATKVLDARIAECDRRLNETKAVLEAEQDPALLKQRNSEWHLGLMAPAADQIVRLPFDPVMRLAEKHNRGLFNDGVKSVTVSLRVAGLTP